MVKKRIQTFSVGKGPLNTLEFLQKRRDLFFSTMRLKGRGVSLYLSGEGECVLCAYKRRILLLAFPFFSASCPLYADLFSYAPKG